MIFDGKLARIVESGQLVDDFTNAIKYKRQGGWYVPVPKKWLKAETWTAREALLLFSNIEPTDAIFEVNDYHDTECSVHLQKCAFLGQDSWTGGVSEIKSFESLRDEINRTWQKIKESYPEFYRKIEDGEKDSAYEWIEDNLTQAEAVNYWEATTLFERYQLLSIAFSRLYFAWNHRQDAKSGFNEEERYQVQYYLNWIVKNECKRHVQWWKESVENGYLPKSICRKEKLSILYEKQEAAEREQKGNLEFLLKHAPELMKFDTLQKRWKSHNFSIDEILNLGQKGYLRFYTYIKCATITWSAIYDNIDDPRGGYDIGENDIPFQVTTASIKKIRLSRNTPPRDNHIQLICPEKLRVPEKDNNNALHNEYKCRIESNFLLWPAIYEKLKVTEETHLENQRERSVFDLWVIEKDVDAYEKKHFNQLQNVDHVSDERGALITPEGTEWHDITFRFQGTEKVSITFGDDRTIERSFKSFGFSLNTNTKRPTKLWTHLLNLAVHNGNPPIAERKEDRITKKHVSDIRGGLKTIFPKVPGKPIGDYMRGKGWPLNINLCVSEYLYKKQQ